jgi:hypothetical protein
LETPIETHTGEISLNDMVMCDGKGKGLVFAFNLLYYHVHGYIEFLRPYSRNLTAPSYPFRQLSNHMDDYPELACSYTGNGQYTITIIVKSFVRNYITLRHGVLNDN